MTLLRYMGTSTAQIVADLLCVSFPDARTVLDLTPGHGCFWNEGEHSRISVYRSDGDFRMLYYGDNSYDVAVFDPPHVADGGKKGLMAMRYGTYANGTLEQVVRQGIQEAWRVARLGTVVKVCDHIHASKFVRMTGWVYDELGEPYDVVHQTRTAMIDPKWRQPQLSARNNGATYVVHRKDGLVHRRRSA